MSESPPPSALEERLRAIGAERYHGHHPFHTLLNDGKLTQGQLQAWALNRYCYQAAIPIKDASLIARMPDSEMRRVWRRRLIDHDGEGADGGGLARWLALTDALGLSRDRVISQEGALPATRFAVEAYVHFVRERSLLEGIASSLTEMFAPTAVAARMAGMLAYYAFVDRAALAYFEARLTQAPRDVGFALAYVKEHAREAEEQRRVLAAVEFKCDVLWAMLDALHFAYVEPGWPPPGAFRTEATPR